MHSNFTSITEYFHKRLTNIEYLDNNLNLTDPDILVEISRASTLLISSGFEEYIRQIATESCKHLVSNTKLIENIPNNLLQTAWKRTFYVISSDLDKELPYLEMYRKAILGATPKIDALFNFIHGDLNQDIYDRLIYNQYNMNADELNNMFKVSGIKNMCKEISKSTHIKDHFGPLSNTIIDLRNTLNQFIIRRNEISHSTGESTRNFSTTLDIKFFRALTKDISLILESKY